MIIAPTEKLALFRADASLRIGGGHVMRCLALADALSAEGWNCIFSVNSEAPDILPALARYPVEPPIDAGRSHGDCGLLVVDHYGLDADWESSCRDWAKRIVAIDDAPGRAHDCDILIDTAPLLRDDAYDHLVPDGCIRLFGPDYAILAPSFAAHRAVALQRDHGDQLLRVFVNFGATAPAACYDRVIDALSDVIRAGVALEAEIVMGAVRPAAIDALRHRAIGLSPNVRIHGTVGNIAELLTWSNVALASAGTSSWERCCLAVPSLIAVTADNQAVNAVALERLGATINLGILQDMSAVDVAAALIALSRDADRLKAMAQRAASICDGLGARRIAARINPPLASDGAPVTLRPARFADADQMLAWQSHPETRREFREPRIPSHDEHMSWLLDKLADPQCLLNIVEHADVPAGVLRLDYLNDETFGSRRLEVSILIAPDRKRLGIAQASLALARMLVPGAVLVAEVLPGNDASHRLFKAAGFRHDGTRYVLDPSGACA
jgi:UDP-2,4-diacetamido-2,4,6-trideoxy-beta-L-altropyranose hydrolase